MTRVKKQRSADALGLAAHLRQLREQKGISQEALARASGLSRDCISRIERLDREPHMRTLVKVAAGLGCRLDDLAKAPAAEATSATDQRAQLQRLVARASTRAVPLMLDAVRLILRAQSGPPATAIAQKRTPKSCP